MSIGSILLQPQTLQRYSRVEYSASFGDESLAVVQQLIIQPEILEPLLAELKPVWAVYGREVLAGFEQNLEQGRQALEELIEPCLTFLNQLVEDAGDLETVGDVLDFVLAIVDKLVEIIVAFNINDIRALVQRVMNILTNDFGLSIELLVQTFTGFIDRTLTVIETVPADLDDDARTARLTLAGLLRRLKTDVLTRMPDLRVSADTIASQIMRALRENGIDTWVEKAQCLAEKIRAAAGAGTRTIEVARAAGGSVGAQYVDPIRTGSQYCWYASWLYASRRRDFDGKLADFIVPLFPTDEVWVSEDGKKLILRRVYNTSENTDATKDKDEVLYESDAPINWYDAPQFKPSGGDVKERFTFTEALSPQFLENWTRAMSTLVYLSKSVSHFVNFAVEPKSYGPNIPAWLWNLTRVVADNAVEAPFPSWLRDQMGLSIGHKTWINMIGTWVPVLAGSAEGHHDDAHGMSKFLYWITLLGDDVLEAFSFHIVPTLIHEGFLSIFTLINYQGPTSMPAGRERDRPANLEYVYPISNAMLLFSNWILVKCIYPRRDYSYPFEPDNVGTYMAWQWGAAPVAGGLSGMLSGFIAWAFSRAVDVQTMGTQFAIGLFKGWGTFIVSHYFFCEGDTDGGKYNPTGDAFDGYPDAATSPYRLPYERGMAKFMGQGNQGFFSHFRQFDGSGLPQIYAYDFAHDLRDEILAVRDGTVVDFFDWIEDNIEPNADQQNDAANEAAAFAGFVSSGDVIGAGTANQDQTDSDSWNFIMIRNDDPFNRETEDEKAHDRDINGNTNVTTYTVYGHGAKAGVRDAFALHDPAVTAPNIIGTKIKRGMPVMLAGDTGISFHNHLHIHVRVDPDPAASGFDTDVVVNPTDLNGDRTIPFVFKDVKHIIAKDGRPLRLTWYKSDNERITS